MFICLCFFFFKQKTAYEMRISDWSSDVCSSDLIGEKGQPALRGVDHRAIALDHPAAFELLHAAQTGRRRQPDALGEFEVRDSPVARQFLQYLAADGVDLDHGLHNLSEYSPSLQSVAHRNALCCAHGTDHPRRALRLRARLVNHAGTEQYDADGVGRQLDRKSTRLNSSHSCASRMPSSA